jgi:hypothetical protein
MGALQLIRDLPKELEDPIYFLRAVEALDGALSLQVMVGDYHPTSPQSDHLKFQITFPRPVEMVMPVGTWCEAFVHEDHPLLWPHTGPQASLSFNGVAERPSEVVGELVAAHQSATNSSGSANALSPLAGRWLPMERFLNQAISVKELLGGGFGTLAQGPQRLMEVYAEVLADADIRPSVHSPMEAKHWEDGSWTARDDLRVAVFLSLGPDPDGYIVSSPPVVSVL